MALPSHLTHLAIYNTTLLPTAAQLQSAEDSDDAYEQAHIVFYSCQERTVSRDRMLRQVGLAKALVNFAGMFHPLPTETNVHSQKKRLITFSPEPDWWIHAGFDLERIPKPVSDKGKTKEKEKKEKEKPPDRDKTGEKGEWEYKDELDDEVLKARLTRGYEEFKLLHGSFSEILHTKDRPGLERALERFFTVWASKWDLTTLTPFTRYLPALPLHPQHALIPPLLPPLQPHLPEGTELMLLAPPQLLHSTSPALPDALFHYLLALLAPPPTASAKPPLAHPSSAHSGTDTPSFLNVMSTMANPRKWGPYLSFGRSASSSSSRSVSHARDAVARTASAPKAPTTAAVLAQANPPELKAVRTSSEPGQLDKDALVEALQDVAIQSKPPSAVEVPLDQTATAEDADVTVTMVESVLPLPATELPGTDTETAESVKVVVVDSEQEKVSAEESKEQEGKGPEEGSMGEGAEEKGEPQERVPPLVKVPVRLPVEGEEETRAVGVLSMSLDGLILAIVPPENCESDAAADSPPPDDLARAVHSFLLSVRAALDVPPDPPSSEHTHLSHSHSARTFSSSLPPPASPLLFSTQQQLAGGVVHETLSRTIGLWVVGERKVRPRGEGEEDVYVEIAKKEMNLSEVDKLVGELVQDLEEGGDA